MKLLVKILLPILVLGVCIITARSVIANRPEPVTRPQFKSTTSIDATRVAESDYPVLLRTQGTVSATRSGSLVPEVAGRIVNVSSGFVVGGSFERGDIMLEIDPRDYEIAVTLAEATFAQASATLAEERARSSQARDDWKRLGRPGNPSSLTLREPQLAAARASLEGARAQVQRAKLDLERTRIIAPYSGIVRSKNVDVGQYVSRGVALGEIYSIDTAEVRLPLSNRQIGFIDLPGRLPETYSKVKLSADVGGTSFTWEGAVVRTEGTIDTSSRQLYAVALVDNPNITGSQQRPLLLGQYVEASITGKILEDVIVIPRSALRSDREVLVVDDLGTLQTRAVTVQWKDSESAVISGGLAAGEVISLTTLGSITNGTRVRATIDGKPPPSEEPGTRRVENGTGFSGPDQRLNKLKALIEAGENIPEQARSRIEARIANGEPVPDWLRAHITDSAAANPQGE